MSSSQHDLIVGKISHLPQILSTALAAKMIDVDSEKLNIAGQGLRDLTRLAQSDSKLWSQILIANREIIKKDLNYLISDLVQLAENLESNNIDKIEKFMQAGNIGKAKIPGKHGEQARDYAYLAVVIDDKPGQLARIFNECADINVNIEDLSMEHSPGQETGLITLALSEADCVKLSSHLEKVGFKVHHEKSR
jgi:prephenate dehydrogenase